MALLKEPRFNNHFRVTLSWHSYLLSKSQQLSLSRNKNTDSNSKSGIFYLENYQSDRRSAV